MTDSEMERAPLLVHVQDDGAVNGAVDFKGKPVLRSQTGSWKSASLIIVVEVTERIAYFGIQSNLITYLTGPLGQTTAMAAENVNAWAGTAALLPLLGAFVADSSLGRYRTITLASVVYVLGLGLLAVSALLSSSNSSQLQVPAFFFALYLVALGQGGHKPCVQAFGADQFDEQQAEECKARSSFFNWWYFTLCAGLVLSHPILSYVQENLSWSLGFGIPCLTMFIGLIVFLLGTKTYRFNVNKNGTNPFTRIGRVFLLAIRNRQVPCLPPEDRKTALDQSSSGLKFLDKALLSPNGSTEGEICSAIEVEEAKAVVRLVPIWATMLIYGIVCAQANTLFIKQGATMERTILGGFKIPSASLQSLKFISIVIFTPIYDQIFVPLARSCSGKSSGITMLQRIGTGMILSIVTMVVAALTEEKRLRTAQEYSLVDLPNVTIPMCIWWLVPQYCLVGIVEVFTMVGLQEFFYDQVPNELRSMGLALYLSIFGAGSFLSGMLISMIEKTTTADGQDGWFAQLRNRSNLIRKLYGKWRRLNDRATGLGVDPRTGVLLAPDEWWNDVAQGDPEVSKWKTAPPKFLDLMTECFGGDVATGADTYYPSYCRGGGTFRAPARPPPPVLPVDQVPPLKSQGQ